MVNRVTIKSSRGRGALIFSSPEIDQAGQVVYFTVELVVESLTVSKRVYCYDPSGYIDLFNRMAENWKGWEGEFTTGAVEGDFIITATADKLGHAILQVELIDHDYGWQAAGSILIDSGQYAVIANQVQEFFHR